jgi:hypothetical protein
LRTYIQQWSIIKNSAEDVSDEQAVDAFSAGLRRSDLVEELERAKPKIVSELMEVANRFADGEDVYNNKRGRSPEVDKVSRQRRRYRNEDGRARRNQIAVGYERREEESYKSREFQREGNRRTEKPKHSGPSAEDMLQGPCRIHYAYLDGKRVSNHQMKDCRTFLRLQDAMDQKKGTRQGGKKYKSRISNAASSKTFGIKSIHICNDPTSAEIQKRAGDHIQTSKSSNIITTSHNRVLEVVRSTSKVQQSRPPKESTKARARAHGVEGANRRIRCGASIYGCRKWYKSNIRKNPEGNVHLVGKP